MSMHRDLAPSIETMQTLDIQAYFEKSSRLDQLVMFIQTGIKYIEQLRKIKNMNLIFFKLVYLEMLLKL